MALEEVKLVQKQRQRKSGIPAMSNGSANSAVVVVVGGGGGNANTSDKKSIINKLTDSALLESGGGGGGGGDADKDKDDLVLQDTFAQETAVMVEDPNMYVSVYIYITKDVCFLFFYLIIHKFIRLIYN